jgi:hypothetical protein
MPRGAIAHISFVVQDLDRAVEKWSRLLGVLDPAALEKPPVYMQGSPGGVTSECATFVNSHGCEIQFMCPKNEAARQAFGCDRFGDEFVHHICFTHPDPQEAGEKLREAGLRTTGFSFEDERDDTVQADGLQNAEWEKWIMAPMDDGNVLVEIGLPYDPVPGGLRVVGDRESSQWVPVEDWTPDKGLG